MASVTVVISVHRRVAPYPVVVLLPASLSLFYYCYYMLINGFCHSCNICTKITIWIIFITYVYGYKKKIILTSFYQPVCPCSVTVTTCLLMTSVTVVIFVHRGVPPYPVVVLLPASLSLFCYCYYMLTDGFCYSCNICTQRRTSLPCSCPSTSQSVLVLLLLLQAY